ncbi:D-alanyl-D-alanine carboxypeptidase family protein [Rhizobium rosettiformans]|uniref:D-alanyl-D-alanine carboxypeptidase family protein n=1 Tax=Rhizobium rosettiformans TaxID=1368430 RepID=UPI002860DEBE|nr:D-alanyl-D-alanine carboxypeptidase family protein [Rhizobium rosettiformans]MDR7027663.1 D-alanyl-D-alanine carboxypeptidase (penicillin-binding protein 5/6) [Rhizobium rosettiformans]MDR7066227.1 D-alanyl-D-alanine carboxypeptidase (penicillin-binding protein 5/6) [Rhizobium rosettiformans]
MRILSTVVLLLASLLSPGLPSPAAFAQTAAPAPLIESKAAQVYLIEASTGTVLFSKNEKKSFAPASLAKLMTLEVVFDALKKGEIRPDTIYPVSEYAWRTGGAPSRTSTMFAAVKSQVPVADLIKGIAVQTANDGCLIIAEGMAGSEAKFVERMNARAAELGLTDSHFANATGLPHPDNRSTLVDLVKLARHLVETYPDLYQTFSLAEFEWNKILQRNRNPLLPIGADGLGTGFAEESGFAIIASMERDGRRLFLGLSGAQTDKERTEEATRLLNWGFDGFEMRTLFKPGEVVGEASVYGGNPAKVPLVAHGPVEVYVPINNPDRLQARIVYRWPLKPPVAADREIATLNILSGERPLVSVPLKSAQAVEVGTLRQRAWDAVIELLFFWI